MPPIGELLLAIVVISVLPVIGIIAKVHSSRKLKREAAEARKIWNETPVLRTLVEQYSKLESKNVKLSRRKEELRMKLTDRAYFPKESTYFKKYEVEYQELYFKQAKLNKEMDDTFREIQMINRETGFSSTFCFSKWREFFKEEKEGE